MSRRDEGLQCDGEEREQRTAANNGRCPARSPLATQPHNDLLPRSLCYIIRIGKRRTASPLSLVRRVEPQDDRRVGRREVLPAQADLGIDRVDVAERALDRALVEQPVTAAAVENA